jgi:hypothetical protein
MGSESERAKEFGQLDEGLQASAWYLWGPYLSDGRDPILKERMFGLTGNEGNHGEDVKEYWWYLDAVPSHSWNQWRYHYPQARFPYDELVQANRRPAPTRVRAG